MELLAMSFFSFFLHRPSLCVNPEELKKPLHYRKFDFWLQEK